jgi:glycosyltransferase involved in cell wall biosynthesis
MKFSVSICVYDKDNPIYFKESLESIINQKLQPNQIVLTIDGPVNSELEDIINDFSKICINENIQYNMIQLEQNKGHGEARRIGIENCQYDTVAIADADDINDYERFYKQIEFFKNNRDASVVGGQILEIEHDTKKAVAKKTVPLNSTELNEYIKRRCPMNQATVMFKKSEVLKAGGYIDFFHNEDYYLWIRMYLRAAKFYNIDSILVYVRVSSDYFSRRGGWLYFKSEYRIQKIMFDNDIIGLFRYIFNVVVRFTVQIILTDRLRGFVFKKLFRKEVKNV